MAKEVTFRILDQRLEQIKDQEIIIHLSGLTQKNKSVYCKVLNYQPFCFLELPVHINWTGPKISMIKQYIQDKLKECPPDVMKFEIKKLAMYSVTRPFLRINFKTEDTMNHLKNLLRFTWRIEGFKREFEPNSFKLHEQNIPTLVKFGMEHKLDMAGWVTVKAINPKGFPKDFSYCDYSLYTLSKWVRKSDVSSEVLVDPLICSFDIELHSVNRKSSSPAPEIPENVVTMVSLTFGRLSEELDKWETYVITLYEGHKKPSGKYKSEVINCMGSEKRLLINFTKLIKRMQPDIMTGYNINGFDWSALLKRADIHNVKPRFLKMGKLKFERDQIKDDSWSSGARGRQEIVYVKMNGVFNFDMYPEIRFNHNLPMYKLGFVAEHFLGKDETKDDMPYQQMFALFDMIEVLERSIENCDKIEPKMAKKLILSKVSKEELLIVPGMTNHVYEFYQDLKDANTLKKIVKTAREYMLRLLKYVIQDARICPALMKFLNSLTALWESSIISKCPPNYVYEKGQQIKVLAQYLEKAHWRNFVIPYYTKPKTIKEDDEESEDGKKNYQGATVLKVLKGLYKDIAILDFKSLYPSIMIANNICHSTLRPNDDTRVKDEDCNIAMWSEHIRCEHDPENRKRKKNDTVYCGDHKYRFVKHNEDESKMGLLPLLLKELLAARKKVKKDLWIQETKWKELKTRKDLSEKERKEMDLAYRVSGVLDARQLAIKVSANSAYGFMGALTGYFPLIAGSASVTYYGRTYIDRTITLIESKYKKAEIIYGDSVTGDTPLLLRKNGFVEIKTIEELGDEWTSYEGFKVDGSNRREKQQSVTEYESWTDTGWAKIKRVIRHKCNKKIYRVTSPHGIVDVTEDHSLLDVDGNILKPNEIGDKELLHSLPDDLNFDDYMFEGPTTCKKDALLAYIKLQKGFKGNFSISQDYNDIFDINLGCEMNETYIQDLGRTKDFVYDLETESGRFHAGVGSLIVKNTDSVFVDFHEPDLKKAFKIAFEAGQYVSDKLPPALELEMENFYSPLLLLTKKRYEYSIINDDGKVLKDGSKGSINKRRDNCDAARDIYTFALKSVMSDQTQEDTVYEINRQILELFRGRVPLHNFIIYKGLKQTIEEYKNCAGHVLFAKRLEDRGNVMKAGTRLEYVFIKKYGKGLKGGEIMEDWSYFLMNRHNLGLHLDYGYYLEHNIMKPVTEVLNIAYPCGQKKFYTPEEAFKLAMDAYLKPKWAKELKRLPLHKRAFYIARNSKKKILREAARNYSARWVLDMMYKKHGLRKRLYRRPKPGDSHVFVNDRIMRNIASYHHDWAEVKNQIKNRINIIEWILLKWEKLE